MEVQSSLNLTTCKRARFRDGSADVGWYCCDGVTQFKSCMICDLFEINTTHLGQPQQCALQLLNQIRKAKSAWLI